MKLMKKTLLRSILAAVLSLTMAFALTAWGGGDALKGTWSGDVPDWGKVTWTFDGSGKCTQTSDLMTMEGSYKIDGDQVTITLVEGTDLVFDFTINGDNLNLDNVSEYAQDYDLTKEK